MIDILEALAAEAPAKSNRKCKVQRWIDEIPEGTPGKDDLISALVTTDPRAEHYRTVDQIDKVVYRLGLTTSTKTLGDHRAKRCRCFV